MESSGHYDFLLGIEEYLNNLGCRDQASIVHSLANSINPDNSTKDPIKTFLMTVAKSVEINDLHLSNLIYSYTKVETQQAFTNALMHYVMHQKTITPALKDLIFKSTKSTIGTEFIQALLSYLAVSLEDAALRNLAFALSKSVLETNFEEQLIKLRLAGFQEEFPSDKLFRGINSCIKNNLLPQEVLNDAFSRSQIRSKFWLIKELEKINKGYKNVLVMAGWFGQLKGIYEKFLNYQKMRIIDLDQSNCELSDYVFNLSNLENHKVKSVKENINNLTLHKNGYEWTIENFKEPEKNYTEKFLPDLIINTSAEHMTEEWFHQIRFKELEPNPIVAIQSNNLFDIEDHVNCVHSIDHMRKKFPMREILYEGELQLKGYKRVMLIGRP